MISTVTLNPALDKTIYVRELLPHDTNRIERIETDIGGKGINAARVLKELGLDALALGFVGGKTGRFIQHELHEEGIRTDFVHVHGETRTNLAVQEASGAPPTALNERGPAASPENLRDLTEKVLRAAAHSEMVLLGGSLTPGAPDDLYRALCEGIAEAGAKVVLDADGDAMVAGLRARPYMIKPNRDEAQRLLGRAIETQDDAVAAVRELAGQVEIAVISMGAEGAIAAAGDEVCRAIPPKVRVVSTIGSGDSMLAGMMSRLCEGGTLGEALALGCAAGAATATTNGAEIGRREDVFRLLADTRVERLV